MSHVCGKYRHAYRSPNTICLVVMLQGVDLSRKPSTGDQGSGGRLAAVRAASAGAPPKRRSALFAPFPRH